MFKYFHFTGAGRERKCHPLALNARSHPQTPSSICGRGAAAPLADASIPDS
jgi:hypothetical protein